MEFELTLRSLAWTQENLDGSGDLLQSGLFGHEEFAWIGATIDTRAECDRKLFFAMKGENTDGHRFATEAMDRGCCAAVIDNKEFARVLEQSGSPFFLVRDTLAALQGLAGAYRNALDLRIIAVTGSSGKTTTKDYIRCILKRKYRVQAGPGNYNNHIGVPLTLLETDYENEYLVAEIAANHRGEIESLARILRPDIGVVTNIGDAHIGLFGSRQVIAESKGELLDGMGAEGWAVLPGDDDFIAALRARASCRTVTFGMAEECAYRVSAVEPLGDRIAFSINEYRVEIKSIGIYDVSNACAAFAVGELCGVEADLVCEALLEREPRAGRAKVYRGNGITLIDDSYNANPSSMRAAITALTGVDSRRRLAVLGEMAELGTFARSSHKELGAYAASAGIDVLFWLGEYGGDVEAGLRSAGGDTAISRFGTFDDLMKSLSNALRDGDAIVVKASRSVQLDRVVSRLLETVLKQEES